MWRLLRYFKAATPAKQSDEDGEAYLVSLGFRVESSHDQWRCGGRCAQMQRPGTFMVWVAHGVLYGDPLWSVVTRLRQTAHNGSFTAWCLACCGSFTGPMTADEMLQADRTPPTKGITLMPGESVAFGIYLSGARDPDDGDTSE